MLLAARNRGLNYRGFLVHKPIIARGSDLGWKLSDAYENIGFALCAKLICWLSVLMI